jgi:hypothetical protein
VFRFFIIRIVVSDALHYRHGPFLILSPMKFKIKAGAVLVRMHDRWTWREDRISWILRQSGPGILTDEVMAELWSQ